MRCAVLREDEICSTPPVPDDGYKSMYAPSEEQLSEDCFKQQNYRNIEHSYLCTRSSDINMYKIIGVVALALRYIKVSPGGRFPQWLPLLTSSSQTALAKPAPAPTAAPDYEKRHSCYTSTVTTPYTGVGTYQTPPAPNKILKRTE